MKKILIASAKGGTGKSTLSLGIAKSLKTIGHKVGLIDCDFTAPNIPVMLNSTNSKPTLAPNRTIIPCEIDSLKVLSWGMLWAKDSSITIEDKQIGEDELQLAINMIKTDRLDKAVKYLEELIENPGGATYYMKQLFEDGVVDWGDVDWLVIDSAPTTSGTVRVLTEIGLYGAVIVTQPTNPSLADVARTIDMFRKKQVPIFGLVCNMLGRFELNESQVKKFAAKHEVPYIYSIPFGKLDQLDGYFIKIVEYITNNKPVTLKPKEVSEEWKETLKDLTKISELIEVLRGK